MTRAVYRRRIAWLLDSHHLLAKAIRFLFVGGMAGVIYVATTALCVSGLGFSPIQATVAGYFVSLPMSFLGHRRFSFRAEGHWTMEALRFIFTQAVNLSVTIGAMDFIVNRLHAAYYWGMLVTVILVPLANFTVMNLWVFRKRADPDGKPQ